MKEEPVSVTDGDFVQGHDKNLVLGHRPEYLFRIFIEHRQRELLHEGVLPEIALGRRDAVEGHLGGLVEGQRKDRRSIHARCRHSIFRNRCEVPDTVTLFVQDRTRLSGLEQTGRGVWRDSRRIVAGNVIHGIDGVLFAPGPWTEGSVGVSE